MNTCDNGCGNGIGRRENPSYELRVVEPYISSIIYKFCGSGCLTDWVTLSSQGLRPISWERRPGMSDEFEETLREGLATN